MENRELIYKTLEIKSILIHEMNCLYRGNIFQETAHHSTNNVMQVKQI